MGLCVEAHSLHSYSFLSDTENMIAECPVNLLFTPNLHSRRCSLLLTYKAGCRHYDGCKPESLDNHFADLEFLESCPKPHKSGSLILHGVCNEVLHAPVLSRFLQKTTNQFERYFLGIPEALKIEASISFH